jgi:hypothetical protein
MHSKLQEVPSLQGDIVSLLNEMSISCLIVQYSGYGFDSRGAPLALLRAIRAWRFQTKTAKLILMAHELWHSPAWWKPDAANQFFHKRELCALAQCADQVFTSTQGYLLSMKPFVEKRKLRCLPIGSNITPVYPPEASYRIPGRWVLFGKQGSRIVSLKTFGSSLSLLHTKGLLQQLVIIGSRDRHDLDHQETRLLQQYLPSQAYVQTGLLTEEQISERLLQAECGVLGQSFESLTKSTILMAYASHGVVPVVASDSLLASSYSWIRTVDDVLTLNAGAHNNAVIRSSLLSWYQQNGDWNQISRAYLEAMSAESS